MYEQVEEIKEIKTAPTTQPQVKDEEKAKENVEEQEPSAVVKAARKIYKSIFY